MGKQLQSIPQIHIEGDVGFGPRASLLTVSTSFELGLARGTLDLTSINLRRPQVPDSIGQTESSYADIPRPSTTVNWQSVTLIVDYSWVGDRRQAQLTVWRSNFVSWDKLRRTACITFDTTPVQVDFPYHGKWYMINSVDNDLHPLKTAIDEAFAHEPDLKSFPCRVAEHKARMRTPAFKRYTPVSAAPPVAQAPTQAPAVAARREEPESVDVKVVFAGQPLLHVFSLTATTLGPPSFSSFRSLISQTLPTKPPAMRTSSSSKRTAG
ncbi:hypothetical protein JCM8547_001962 [Rhodosporidiobolus lusitaniae]